MTKALSKVVYKADAKSTSEYTVIVNPEEYKKWKAGDTTIPLAEVVDSFTVFHSTQGHQGFLGQASKQQLETDFGTSKNVDIVTTILNEGKNQASEGIGSSSQSITNIARGNRGSVDLRSKP